jgi:hypothetical protein
MKLHLHDATPSEPGNKHGPRGPTHCGDLSVDHEYQAEERVKEIEADHPHVMRIECPDLRREWVREGGTFVERPAATRYDHATIYLDGKPLFVGDVSFEPSMPNVEEVVCGKRDAATTSATFESTFTFDVPSSDALLAFVEQAMPGPPDVQVNLPRPAGARPLTRRQVAALCEGTRRGLAEIGGFAGRVVPAPELVAHLEERRRARNKRKAERRARLGKAQKPRRARQHVAGLCRRLAREEGTR